MDELQMSGESRVLVVDDDQQTTEYISTLLEEIGCVPQVTNFGEDALAALRKAAREPGADTRIDLVILDVMLPDVDGRELLRRIKRDDELKFVPIIMVTALGSTRDKTLGLEIGADDYLSKPFQAEELVARVKAMLRIRKMEQEIIERNRELSVLNAIAETVSRSLELAEVLDQSLEAVLREMGLKAGAIHLWDRSADELSLHTQRGFPAGWVEQVLGKRLKLGEGLVGGVAQSGRIEVRRDLAPPAGQATDRHALACLPITSQDEVLGTMTVFGPDRLFEPRGIDLLVAINTQMATAVEKAQLYAFAVSRTSEMATLNEINRAVTSTLDLDQILTLTMRGIGRILHVEVGSLLLLDEEGQLVFKKSLGLDLNRISLPPLKLGQGIAGHVAQTGRPLLVTDAQNDPRFYPDIDRLTGFITQSVLCVPLVVKERVIGVIEVINKLDGRFTDSDLELLNSMASSVAIAIENARLYTDLSDFTRELETSQAQLIQAEKLAATGRLTASIAHELNNPLQAIRNCLHLVLRRSLSEEKKGRYLAMAQEEVERLISIVQRMLDFYRPSRGGMGPTDVDAILDSVLALANKRLQHGKVTVHRQPAAELPLIEAVSDQLKQVFLNIVINAVEAMPNGGDLYIKTTLSQDGQWLSISFADTGVGLTPEEQKNIFEPFFTTKTKGTGLGLSVSYGIIERHGGNIEVESEEGKGTAFTVKLPLSSPMQD